MMYFQLLELTAHSEYKIVVGAKGLPPLFGHLGNWEEVKSAFCNNNNNKVFLFWWQYVCGHDHM